MIEPGERSLGTTENRLTFEDELWGTLTMITLFQGHITDVTS
jgi:hypothetical protein